MITAPIDPFVIGSGDAQAFVFLVDLAAKLGALRAGGVVTRRLPDLDLVGAEHVVGGEFVLAGRKTAV
jgi:hypothetical protein